jgi:hypothetical protein
MDENKSKALYFITEEIHTDIDNVYESASDDDVEEAIKNIDLAIQHLKDLKNNLTIKDEV